MARSGLAIGGALVSLILFACAGMEGARAADMPFYADQVPQTKVEFGTGWYIRGDLAYANESMPQILPDLTSVTNARQSAMSGGLGFGYKFNNWIRADFVGDYRSPNRSSGEGASRVCITQLTPDPVTSVPIPTATDRCTPHQTASIRQWDLIPNLYLDLGTWYGVTPYIGAGAGMSFTRTSTSTSWFMSNGNIYHVTTDGFYYNWDSSTTAMSYQFAWALMAGGAYQLSDAAFIDVGYRYLNLGNYTSFTTSGIATKHKDDVHEIRVGIRYMVDAM